MAVSYLCVDCFSEGTTYGFAGLVAGPPTHCHGKNDKAMPGVLGGFRCICECNRPPKASTYLSNNSKAKTRGNGSRKRQPDPITNGSTREGGEA